MSALYFGPWCGEFGWEIMWAIPVLRRLAADFDHVTVCGPVGHARLWDFAHEYIEVETNGGTCYQRGELLSPAPAPPSGATVITPDVLWRRFGKRERAWLAGDGDSPPPKSWHQYDEPAPAHAPDVLLTLRGPKDGHAWKGWPENEADQLTEHIVLGGHTVGAIGGPDNYLPPHATDFRGVPLDMLIGLMKAARVVAGPSSGPLHLAAVSGAQRIVTWFAGPDDARQRYETQWNPFDVPVGYVCSGFQPSAAHVAARLFSDTIEPGRIPTDGELAEMKQTWRNLHKVERQ